MTKLLVLIFWIILIVSIGLLKTNLRMKLTKESTNKALAHLGLILCQTVHWILCYFTAVYVLFSSIPPLMSIFIYFFLIVIISKLVSEKYPNTVAGRFCKEIMR